MFTFFLLVEGKANQGPDQIYISYMFLLIRRRTSALLDIVVSITSVRRHNISWSRMTRFNTK